MAASVPSQPDVGRVLRRTRQLRHVDLDQAAKETRIPKRYLEALEADAPVETYPAPVYARAFLREYAAFLGLDAGPLLTSFAQELPAEVQLATLREAVPPPRRWPGRVVLGISIVTLAGLAAVGVMSSQKQGNLGPLRHEHPAAAAPHPSPPGPPPAPHRPAFSGITANLHVLDRTWVQAVADGRVVFQGIWTGHWHVFKASSALDLTLGNAGGARLVLNGQQIPTGSANEVVHLAVSMQKGRIRVTRA
jgi:Helix-turn-helix domain/Domain of unknown function (DUF4115)